MAELKAQIQAERSAPETLVANVATTRVANTNIMLGCSEQAR